MGGRHQRAACSGSPAREQQRCRRRAVDEAAGEPAAVEGSHRGRCQLRFSGSAMWAPLWCWSAGGGIRATERLPLFCRLPGGGQSWAASDGQSLAKPREPHHQGRIARVLGGLLPRAGALPMGLRAPLLLRAQPQAAQGRAGQLPRVACRTRGARASGPRRRPARTCRAARDEFDEPVAAQADERQRRRRHRHRLRHFGA